MVKDYHGDTCVAFLDVSGFKREVKADINLAASTLNKFYQKIYDVCLSINEINKPTSFPKVNMIVASDCAVVFSRTSKRRNTSLTTRKIRILKVILDFIQQVNCLFIDPSSPPAILTTCSVAYGLFVYQDKRELSDLRKNCFLGTPYMEAFMDNEELKFQPGYSRLLRKRLDLRLSDLPKNKPFSLLTEQNQYWYFYWMLDNLNYLQDFEREYQEACQLEDPLRYVRIKEVLHKYSSLKQTF